MMAYSLISKINQSSMHHCGNDRKEHSVPSATHSPHQHTPQTHTDQLNQTQMRYRNQRNPSIYVNTSERYVEGHNEDTQNSHSL